MGQFEAGHRVNWRAPVEMRLLFPQDRLVTRSGTSRGEPLREIPRVQYVYEVFGDPSDPQYGREYLYPDWIAARVGVVSGELMSADLTHQFEGSVFIRTAGEWVSTELAPVSVGSFRVPGTVPDGPVIVYPQVAVHRIDSAPVRWHTSAVATRRVAVESVSSWEFALSEMDGVDTALLGQTPVFPFKVNWGAGVSVASAGDQNTLGGTFSDRVFKGENFPRNPMYSGEIHLDPSGLTQFVAAATRAYQTDTAWAVDTGVLAGFVTEAAESGDLEVGYRAHGPRVDFGDTLFLDGSPVKAELDEVSYPLGRLKLRGPLGFPARAGAPITHGMTASLDLTSVRVRMLTSAVGTARVTFLGVSETARAWHMDGHAVRLASDMLSSRQVEPGAMSARNYTKIGGFSLKLGEEFVTWPS